MNVFEFAVKYKIIALAFVVWVLWLVTWVTLRVFDDLSQISMPVSAAYATVFALPSLAWAAIQWRRNRDGG
jgi:hypothetical protein